jgi:hypothetical protein
MVIFIIITTVEATVVVVVHKHIQITALYAIRPEFIVTAIITSNSRNGMVTLASLLICLY